MFGVSETITNNKIETITKFETKRPSFLLFTLYILNMDSFFDHLMFGIEGGEIDQEIIENMRMYFTVDPRNATVTFLMYKHLFQDVQGDAITHFERKIQDIENVAQHVQDILKVFVHNYEIIQKALQLFNITHTTHSIITNNPRFTTSSSSDTPIINFDPFGLLKVPTIIKSTHVQIASHLLDIDNNVFFIHATVIIDFFSRFLEMLGIIHTELTEHMIPKIFLVGRNNDTSNSGSSSSAGGASSSARGSSSSARGSSSSARGSSASARGSSASARGASSSAGGTSSSAGGASSSAGGASASAGGASASAGGASASAGGSSASDGGANASDDTSSVNGGESEDEDEGPRKRKRGSYKKWEKIPDAISYVDELPEPIIPSPGGGYVGGGGANPPIYMVNKHHLRPIDCCSDFMLFRRNLKAVDFKFNGSSLDQDVITELWKRLAVEAKQPYVNLKDWDMKNRYLPNLARIFISYSDKIDGRKRRIQDLRKTPERYAIFAQYANLEYQRINNGGTKFALDELIAPPTNEFYKQADCLLDSQQLHFICDHIIQQITNF